MKGKYGFPLKEEFHTQHFLTDKKPYRDLNLSKESKQEMLIEIIKAICELDIQVVNVIIDKTRIRDTYPVLENALKYNIQRIENTSKGDWNYIVITDDGRLGPMRKTARKIRNFNPIQSKFGFDYTNKPINYLIEDIMSKDSKESYFIQVSDFISYFVNLYYKIEFAKLKLPNRVGEVIDNEFVKRAMKTFDHNGILNIKASNRKYGLVIYPK